MSGVNNGLGIQHSLIGGESHLQALTPTSSNWHGRIVRWISSSFDACVSKIKDVYRSCFANFPTTQPATSLQTQKSVTQSADMTQMILSFLPPKESAALRPVSKAFNTSAVTAAKVALRNKTEWSLDELMEYAQLLSEKEEVKGFNLYEFLFGKKKEPPISSLASLNIHLKGIKSIDLSGCKDIAHAAALLKTLSPSILEKIEVINLNKTPKGSIAYLVDTEGKGMFPNLNKVVGAPPDTTHDLHKYKIFKNGFCSLFTTGRECYMGELIDGVMQGKGSYTDSGGAKWEGIWGNGMLQGEGIYIDSLGSKKEGRWENGVLQGEGTYTNSSRDIFKGIWRNGRLNGLGTCTFANSDRYEGEMGRYEGKDISAGELKGQGTCMYANGDKYAGQWSRGQRNGRGIYTYKNGDRYEGNWREGRPTGEGIYISVNNDRYAGRWIDNKKYAHELDRRDANFSLRGFVRVEIPESRKKIENGTMPKKENHVDVDGRIQEGNWTVESYKWQTDKYQKG